MRRSHARFLAFAVLMLAVAPVEARDRVALTFDDLPGLTNLRSQAYVTYFNEALLRGLK
jgi:hypothetical protein